MTRLGSREWMRLGVWNNAFGRSEPGMTQLESEDDAFGELVAWVHAYFGSREWMRLGVWNNAFGRL